VSDECNGCDNGDGGYDNGDGDGDGEGDVCKVDNDDSDDGGKNK
jgi:hypothetical protein